MLTPQDKIAVGKNDIIQIVVTRNCNLFNCSNCTQLLPFRQDAKEMSLDCAEEALKGTQGWPGIVAMFGGNPCNHSKFEQLCDLWDRWVYPGQRGLWTNDLVGKGLRASHTFLDGVSRFNLNVHGSESAAEEMRRWFPKTRAFGMRASMHGQVIGNYREYVTDEEWQVARENCDINQKWSAGVYARERQWTQAGVLCSRQEPYAYFCEVAGAIDGVTGENNGVPATMGWWKRPIAEFQRQIDRCCDQHCVVPLRHRGHRDFDDTYDVSATRAVIANRGRVKLNVVTNPEHTRELTDYQGLRG